MGRKPQERGQSSSEGVHGPGHIGPSCTSYWAGTQEPGWACPRPLGGRDSTELLPRPTRSVPCQPHAVARSSSAVRRCLDLCRTGISSVLCALRWWPFCLPELLAGVVLMCCPSGSTSIQLLPRHPQRTAAGIRIP